MGKAVISQTGRGGGGENKSPNRLALTSICSLSLLGTLLVESEVGDFGMRNVGEPYGE